jgi:hypothetical protein
MIYEESKTYHKPEVCWYRIPAERGFSVSDLDDEKDNDFDYGDGGDAW